MKNTHRNSLCKYVGQIMFNSWIYNVNYNSANNQPLLSTLTAKLYMKSSFATKNNNYFYFQKSWFFIFVAHSR